MNKFKFKELLTIPILMVVWVLIVHLGFEISYHQNVSNLEKYERDDAKIFVNEAENDFSNHLKTLIYYVSRIDAYVQNRFYNPDSTEIKSLIWDLIKNNYEYVDVVSLSFGTKKYIYNGQMKSISPNRFS